MTDSSSPDTPDQQPALRSSDADRERVAGQLQKHFADGRLTFDELQERLEQTYAARTVAELDRITEDLPADPAPPAPPVDRRPRSRAPGRTSYEYLISYAVFMLFLIAIWAASGRHGSFWPIWPIIVFGALVARRLARDLGR
jgi:hypothetical protein